MSSIYLIDYPVGESTHGIRIAADSAEQAMERLKLAAEKGFCIGRLVSEFVGEIQVWHDRE